MLASGGDDSSLEYQWIIQGNIVVPTGNPFLYEANNNNDGINDDDGLGFAIEPIIPTIPTSYYDDTSGVEDFIGDLVGVDDDALPSLVVSAFEDDNYLDSNNNE